MCLRCCLQLSSVPVGFERFLMCMFDRLNVQPEWWWNWFSGQFQLQRFCSLDSAEPSSNLSYNLLSETEYLNQRLQLALSRFCSWRLSFCSDEFGAPQCIQITDYYCCCCCCLIMSCYLIFALASPQIHPFRKLAWKSRRVHESVESMIKTSSSGSANCYFNHHHQPTVNIHSICEVLGHRMSSHFMRSDRFTTANRQEKEESTRNSVHINGHDTWCHIS